MTYLVQLSDHLACLYPGTTSCGSYVNLFSFGFGFGLWFWCGLWFRWGFWFGLGFVFALLISPATFGLKTAISHLYYRPTKTYREK